MELIIRHCNDSLDRTYQYHEIETLCEPQAGRKPEEIYFITGNKNKVAELSSQIKFKHAILKPLNLDLTEIQDSDPLNIVADKCKQAYAHLQKVPVRDNEMLSDQQVRRFVLVEDCCLNYKALNGMPGPYIKWFLSAVGVEGLHKILAGYDDKSAEAVCIYALMNDESKIVFCKGVARGRITAPRGESWGWDPIFQEERSGLTYGEMNQEMKSKFSHRSNAILVLNKYLGLIR